MKHLIWNWRHHKKPPNMHVLWQCYYKSQNTNKQQLTNLQWTIFSRYPLWLSSSCWPFSWSIRKRDVPHLAVAVVVLLSVQVDLVLIVLDQIQTILETEIVLLTKYPVTMMILTPILTRRNITSITSFFNSHWQCQLENTQIKNISFEKTSF